MITSFLTDGAAKIITRLKNSSVLTLDTIKHLPIGVCARVSLDYIILQRATTAAAAFYFAKSR